jgi:hypothetical protein
MLGFSKEKKEKPDKSREEKKEKVKKKLPPMKNKQSRPAKGQLPDPTFSQMKFAYRTTLADVDGSKTNSIGKKKAPSGVRGLSKGFLFLFPRLPKLQSSEEEVQQNYNSQTIKVKC